MLYMFHCVDRADAVGVRATHRPAHVAYLEAAADRIFAAGPLLADDGETMVGSLLLVDCADRAAAEAFAAGDPYAQAGLFARVEISPWRKVFPKA